MNNEIGDNVRILVVDDNPSIHTAMRKVLQKVEEVPSDLDKLEAELFGETHKEERGGRCFEVVSAYQGQEALAMVEAAIAEGRPYALAFMDVRMPPGWDGIETMERIWRIDPTLQVVICTAYSDHSWSEISERFGPRDGWLIVKKPWDVVEVVQVAHSLTRKWSLHRQVRDRLVQLETLVRRRSSELRAAGERVEGGVGAGARAEIELRAARMLTAVAEMAGTIQSQHESALRQIEDTERYLDEIFHGVLKLLAQAESTSPLKYEVAGVVQQPESIVPGAFASTFEGMHALGTLIRTLIRTTEHLESDAADRGLPMHTAQAVLSAYGEIKTEAEGQDAA
jgi:CheY-like chemotaxis protein